MGYHSIIWFFNEFSIVFHYTYSLSSIIIYRYNIFIECHEWSLSKWMIEKNEIWLNEWCRNDPLTLNSIIQFHFNLRIELKWIDFIHFMSINWATPFTPPSSLKLKSMKRREEREGEGNRAHSLRVASFTPHYIRCSFIIPFTLWIL